MKRLLPLALFLAFAAGQAIAAGSTATEARHTKGVEHTERRPSDIDGVDWIASYEAGPLPAAYRAQTACGLPLDDPYVIQRDADKGLVFLKEQHDRRVKQYTVPGARVRAIVHVKYDMAVLDRADLVFTDRPGANLVLVHTTAENAGIFISSDIYPLAYRDGRVIDRHHLISDPALNKMVAMGVSLYGEAARVAAHSAR
jgi:ABC-type amino acid transport substrate-binding protein